MDRTLNRLLPEAPLTIGAARLVVVTRLAVQVSGCGLSRRLHASKTPYALLVSDGRGLRALDMAGQPTPIGEFAGLLAGSDSI